MCCLTFEFWVPMRALWHNEGMVDERFVGGRGVGRYLGAIEVGGCLAADADAAIRIFYIGEIYLLVDI